MAIALVDPNDVVAVRIQLDHATEEEVLVDETRGPLVYFPDGSAAFCVHRMLNYLPKRDGSYGPPRPQGPKKWEQMTDTEQKMMLQITAKKNRGLKNWKGEDFWQEVVNRLTQPEEADPADLLSREELQAILQEQVARRCAADMTKRPVQWQTITVETVTEGHRKKAPGMLYGIEFPWTEDMLLEMGTEWLTRAFHTAGTLSLDNRVTRILPEKKIKVTTGNNGNKFLFDVRYAKKEIGLHRRLFAKCPFPLDSITRSDRLSSSVNKQPQELYEINTSRLLEASLPVKIPKFYYGDISNETSNFILITECVKFEDPEDLNFGRPKRSRRPRLEPFKIEGPYDKCIDYNLRGDAHEYYLLLVKTGAKIAALFKAGKMGSPELLAQSFQDLSGMPIASWGMMPAGASGEDPRQLKTKLDIAVGFISDVGQVLFPEYATTEEFIAKFRTLMMTMNAYKAEISFWKHANPDYLALTHQNLNVDNAYFWRDEKGKLDLGVFDWGAMGNTSLGHKLWWWIYCSDYELFKSRLGTYVKAFVATYQEHGGPALDEDNLRMMVIITAFEQMVMLVAAVPQIYKMCPKNQWSSIQDRFDARIAENIDGKSTLRLYLHVIEKIVRIIEEMEGDAVLERWIQEKFVGEFKLEAKTPDMIAGIVGYFSRM